MTAPATHPTDVVVLEAGGARVEILPALGGKIGSLRLAGREWLWTNDAIPRTAPTDAVAADDGASYVRTADTGGYDECLPTVAACAVDVPGAGRVLLPDHGELWAQQAAVERVAAPGGGAAAVTRWTGRRLAYAFERTVTVRPDGDVRMDYALTSRAAAALPFLWSSHPLLPLTPDTRLDLPVAARARVWDETGVALGGRGAEHRWPILRVGGPRSTPFGPREVDFTFPALAPQRFGDGGRAEYACKLFLDLPRAAGRPVRLGVEQDGARLEVVVDAAEVPHLGLWINRGGWTPFDGRPGYHTLGFEPCIGAGDALDAATAAGGGQESASDTAGAAGWGPAQWLAPGETRRWTLTWRGRAAPARA